MTNQHHQKPDDTCSRCRGVGVVGQLCRPLLSPVWMPLLGMRVMGVIVDQMCRTCWGRGVVRQKMVG